MPPWKAKAFTASANSVPSPIPSIHAAENNVTKCGFYGDWARPDIRFASTLQAGQLVNSFYTIVQLDAMAELGRADLSRLRG